MLSALVIITGVGTLIYTTWSYTWPWLSSRGLWRFLVLFSVLIFTSGQMFNQIRNTPYVGQDGRGHISYIAGGFQSQFAIETQIIGVLCKCPLAPYSSTVFYDADRSFSQTVPLPSWPSPSQTRSPAWAAPARRTLLFWATLVSCWSSTASCSVSSVSRTAATRSLFHLSYEVIKAGIVRRKEALCHARVMRTPLSQGWASDDNRKGNFQVVPRRIRARRTMPSITTGRRPRVALSGVDQCRHCTIEEGDLDMNMWSA